MGHTSSSTELLFRLSEQPLAPDSARLWVEGGLSTDVLEPDRWSTERPGIALPSPIEPRLREWPEPLFKEVSEW